MTPTGFKHCLYEEEVQDLRQQRAWLGWLGGQRSPFLRRCRAVGSTFSSSWYLVILWMGLMRKSLMVNLDWMSCWIPCRSKTTTRRTADFRRS